MCGAAAAHGSRPARLLVGGSPHCPFRPSLSPRQEIAPGLPCAFGKVCRRVSLPHAQRYRRGTAPRTDGVMERLQWTVGQVVRQHRRKVDHYRTDHPGPPDAQKCEGPIS